MTTTTNADIVSELKHIKEELSAIRRDMNAKNYISEDEFKLALAEATAKEFKPYREAILAPHFVLYIRGLLEEKYGKDVNAITRTLQELCFCSMGGPLMAKLEEKVIKCIEIKS